MCLKSYKTCFNCTVVVDDDDEDADFFVVVFFLSRSDWLCVLLLVFYECVLVQSRCRASC